VHYKEGKQRCWIARHQSSSYYSSCLSYSETVDHVTHFQEAMIFFHRFTSNHSPTTQPDSHVNIENKNTFVRTENDPAGVTTETNY